MADNIVVSDQAKGNFLTSLIAGLLASSKLHLLSASVTNDRTLTASTCLANEASFTGYSVATLTGWSASTIDGSTHYAKSAPTTPGFTPTSGGGSGNLYGGFIMDSTNTYLLGAFIFAGGPITVAQNVQLQVAIEFDLGSIFSN